MGKPRILHITPNSKLCDACNMSLGLLKESEETLTSAIEYLRKHSI